MSRKRKLNPDYQRFYDSQVQLEDSSKETLLKTLETFPEPDKINDRWFRGIIKKYAVATVRFRRTIVLQVLDFLERYDQMKELKKVKIPRAKRTVTVKDLYTKEELDKIFQATTNSRDRAIVQVLYESACRIDELLNLKYKDISFDVDGTANIRVSGKTGTRSIPIFASVPALRDWMNHHPTGDGYLWRSFRSPFQRLHRTHIYNTVNTLLKHAGIKGKKKILHMFRHTRLTEFVRANVIGQPLHKVAGWNGAQMEQVYIHLSTTDVENEIKTKVFGLGKDQQPYEPIIKPHKCLRCSEVNQPNARYCVKCNMPISEDALLQELERKQLDEESISLMFQSFMEKNYPHLVTGSFMLEDIIMGVVQKLIDTPNWLEKMMKERDEQLEYLAKNQEYMRKEAEEMKLYYEESIKIRSYEELKKQVNDKRKNSV